MNDEISRSRRTGSTPISTVPEGGDGSDRTPSLDWMLQLLVAMINSDPRNSMGLTLSVRGSVVSGIAVHRGRWAEEMMRAVVEAGSESEGSPVADVFRSVKMDAEAGSDLGEESVRTGFIHLVDASVDQVLVGHWRGRLSRVDGWSLGVV